MPSSRTLLERLADPSREMERTTRIDWEALADSVLKNLGRMLNTRRGSAPSVPDYGVPELSELLHSFPEAIAEMQRAIKSCIERYEPRLEELAIRHVTTDEDVLMLRFEITARLCGDPARRPVWFETTIDSSGEAKVRR